MKRGDGARNLRNGLAAKISAGNGPKSSIQGLRAPKGIRASNERHIPDERGLKGETLISADPLSGSHGVSDIGSLTDHETADPSSSIQGVSCICSGNIHSGCMQVTGSGRHSRVSVLDKGNELQTEFGALPPIAVAKELLERLVLYEAIAVAVQAGEKRTRDGDPSRVS